MREGSMDYANDLTTFTRLLLSGKPDRTYSLIWTLPDKVSRWNATADDVISCVTGLDRRLDVYIGCGWSPEALDSNRRTKAKDIIGVPGFWADIDVAGAAHKKPNLPPSKDAALKLIQDTAPVPTLVTDSGHGLHCWWLFDRGWIFYTDDERKQAMELSKLWQDYLKAQFRLKGWDLDATFDFARIFRVPGTINHKVKGDEREAHIYHGRYWEQSEDNAWYQPEDIRQWIKLHDDVLTPTLPIFNGAAHGTISGNGASPLRLVVDNTDGALDDYVIDVNANPPMDKWAALTETDSKIDRTWKHTRKDMQDQSLSSYDLALMSYALHARWTIQEAVNLVIAHRRRYGDTDKVSRRDYLNATIRRALTSIVSDTAVEDLVSDALEHKRAKASLADATHASDIIGTAPEIDTETETEEDAESDEDTEERGTADHANPDVDTKNDELLAKITLALGVSTRIRKFVKFETDPPIYFMVLDEPDLRQRKKGKLLRTEKIGGVEQFQSQAAWKHIVGNVWQEVMKPIKKGDWPAVLSAMYRCVHRDSAGEEGSDQGRMLTWLKLYYDQCGITELNEDQRNEAILSERPYRDGGSIVMFGNSFRKWLKTHQLESGISQREMGILFRMLGGQQKTVNVTLDEGKGRTTKSVWILPLVGLILDSEEVIDSLIHGKIHGDTEVF